MKKRMTIIATAAAALAVTALPATSSASDDEVSSAGECTGASRVEIKAKPDDGALEVELEVDQNRNGVPWKVKIKDNGEVVLRDTARTSAPSGSFSIERKIPNRSGADQLTGIARNKQTGERCAARVSI